MIRKSVIKTIYSITTRSNNPKILSRIDTANMIRDNILLSISRFGDGELGMVIGDHSVGFQEYDHSLARRLQDILKTVDENLLVCIPNVFESVNLMDDTPKTFWQSWVVHNKKDLMQYLSKDVVYGDSLVSRLFVPWKDKQFEPSILCDLRKSWEGRRLIVVEGQKSRCGVGNELFANAGSIKRIICPAENAWNKYDKILSVCQSIPMKESPVFFLALGPTATVLAYDLHKSGFRALDMGHLDLQYEYMLRGMNSKGNIPGKYNNEVEGGYHVEDISDQDYEDSIIAKIL